MTPNSKLYLTSQDLDRLERLVQISTKTPNVVALEEEIETAEIVERSEIPADVVTMNSRIRFVDEESGDETEVTLVYPSEADASAGRVSVLAPVGMALLGLSVGQSIEWPMPTGQSRRLRVVAVPYQPEAAGDRDR
jgi:regulator of nucleoside diphosphate kinase